MMYPGVYNNHLGLAVPISTGLKPYIIPTAYGPPITAVKTPLGPTPMPAIDGPGAGPTLPIRKRWFGGMMRMRRWPEVLERRELRKGLNIRQLRETAGMTIDELRDYVAGLQISEEPGVVMPTPAIPPRTVEPPIVRPPVVEPAKPPVDVKKVLPLVGGVLAALTFLR